MVATPATAISESARRMRAMASPRVGAQVTRANKEKNDAATKEYRKVYMRYKMMTNRHPEDAAAAEKFEQLTIKQKISDDEALALVDQADHALYLAKQSGRNRAHCATL